MKALITASAMLASLPLFAVDHAKALTTSDGIELELHPNGEFAVASYPENAEARIELKALHSFNLGSSLSEVCAKMPARIKLMKSPFLSEASKATYREGLLNLNQIHLNVASSLWLKPDALQHELFEASALDAVF